MPIIISQTKCVFVSISQQTYFKERKFVQQLLFTS